MITEEFLAELQNVRDSFEWKLMPDSSRRGRELRAQPRKRIRGSAKEKLDGFLFEPIGALCYARTGNAYTDEAWLTAANALDLSLIDAGDLIAAANDRTWVEVSGGLREPSPYMQRLRERLAASVGLQI